MATRKRKRAEPAARIRAAVTTTSDQLFDTVHQVWLAGEQRGMETLQSIECRDNRGALEVEKDLGFQISFYPDDPRLDLVSKRLGDR